MKLVLQDVKKCVMVNSIKGCREVNDKDNYTKPLIHGDKNVVNKFEQESFTAVMPLVTILKWNMVVVFCEIVINTVLDNSFNKLTHKR